MGNEKDWEELNQWREKKEEEQKADLERRKHSARGLKEQEKEEKLDSMILAAKMVHFSKDLGKVIVENKDEAKLSILVIACCILMVWWNIGRVPNPKKIVKEQYGKDFSYISKEEIATKTTLYTFSSKKYPDLYFHVKLERGEITEDVKQSCLKYFFEKLEQPLKEKFTVEMEEKDGMLKNYQLAYIFQDFNEIDEAVETVYQMRQILKKEIGDCDKVYTKSKSDIYLTLFYDQNFDLEQSKEEGKRQYVNALQERINKKKEDDEKITETEKDESVTAEIIEKYCRPDLAIYINGKTVAKNGGTQTYPVKANYTLVSIVTT